MRVELRNPRRTVDVDGPLTVDELLAELDIEPMSVLVIRGDTLVTSTHALADTDTVEIRPVISGGQ